VGQWGPHLLESQRSELVRTWKECKPPRGTYPLEIARGKTGQGGLERSKVASAYAMTSCDYLSLVA